MGRGRLAGSLLAACCSRAVGPVFYIGPGSRGGTGRAGGAEREQDE